MMDRLRHVLAGKTHGKTSVAGVAGVAPVPRYARKSPEIRPSRPLRAGKQFGKRCVQGQY